MRLPCRYVYRKASEVPKTVTSAGSPRPNRRLNQIECNPSWGREFSPERPFRVLRVELPRGGL